MMEQIVKLMQKEPKRWWHVTEIMKRLNISRQSANRQLYALAVKWKILERKLVRLDGRLTYLYRLRGK